MLRVSTKAILMTTAAAMLMASPVMTTSAQAKIKEVKFHFVKSQYIEPPTMVMEYSKGKWTWINQSKVFKAQVKIKAKSKGNRINHAQLSVGGKTVWALPSNYKTYKIEDLLDVGISKQILASSKNSAANLCGVFGGDKKVIRDMNIKAAFSVVAKGDNAGKSGKLLVKVACMGKPEPTRNPVTLQVSKLKLYTIPKKPKCGQPVKMITEIHTNKPGKVNFKYVRDDGEHQSVSLTTAKGGKGYSKRWAKTYTFNKSTNRKYMAVTIGHKFSTNWVPIKVSCG